MWKNLLDIDNDFHVAWSQLGLTYAKQNKLSKAREAFEKALKLHPNDRQVLYNLKLVKQKIEASDNHIAIAH